MGFNLKLSNGNLSVLSIMNSHLLSQKFSLSSSAECFLILSLNLFHADIVQRQSLIGSRVILPCNTSSYSNEPEDAISLIFWYKIDPTSPGPGITVYSIDGRSNYDVTRAKHFIADHLKGRVKFDIKYPSISNLIIDNVTFGDEGEYRCRVREELPFLLSLFPVTLFRPESPK